MMENVVSAQSAGPPLHMHDFDEAFYMLEGELIFQIGDERFTRRAGEFAFAPRNVVHALANHSDAVARYLLVCTPAGLERHFARAAAASQGVEPPDWALQPSPEITGSRPADSARGLTALGVGVSTRTGCDASHPTRHHGESARERFRVRSGCLSLASVRVRCSVGPRLRIPSDVRALSTVTGGAAVSSQRTMRRKEQS